MALFLTEAQHLRARIKEEPLPIGDHNAWVERVKEYLRDNFGTAHEARFSDFTGIVFYGGTPMSRSIDGRTRRLHEFLSEMGVQ